MDAEEVYQTLDSLPIIQIGVKLLGDKVQKRPHSENYRGLCPFHEETNPSFYLKPEWNWFVCYGCNERGGPIGLASNLVGNEFWDFLLKQADLQITLTPLDREIIMEYEIGKFLNVDIYANS